MKRVDIKPLLFTIIAGTLAFSSIYFYVPEISKKQEQEVIQEVDALDESTIGSFDVKDGTYQGTGTGYHGDINVSVTIKDKSITDIQILSYQDDDNFFNRAKTLISDIISKQSYDVDTVSGATYSSKGIIAAVKNAITGKEDDSNVKDKSKKITVSKVDESSSYKDGTYYGSARGFSGTTKVKVIIKNGKIAKVTIVSHGDTESFFNKAKKLISKIVNKQSTNVDTVSGATYSSRGIINATRNALNKAKVSKKTTNKKETVTSIDLSKINDGTYYGTAKGFGGDIEVAVTVKDHQIISIVTVNAEDETPLYFNKAASVMDTIIQKQSTTVDTISGATYSSTGIINAVIDALENQKTKEETNEEEEQETEDNTERGPYKDGTYTGSAIVYDLYGNFSDYTLTLKVTVENGYITSITDVLGPDGADDENAYYIDRAANGTSKKTGVVKQIIAKNSTDDIDAISGATCSSDAIVEAVKNLLAEIKE